jgi:hypothetical protein
MRSGFKAATVAGTRRRIYQGIRSIDDIPTDYTPELFETLLSREFGVKTDVFFERFSNAWDGGGSQLDDFMISFRLAVCVAPGDRNSACCSIPNEITQMLVNIVLRTDISAMLLIDTLYVLDVALKGDPSAEHFLCNQPVLDLMGQIFQCCLTESSPFTIADSMPLLRIAINLASSDRNAELIYFSRFSALCTSSFLYPNAEESSPWMAARVVKLITRIFIHQSDSFAVPGEVVNEIIEKFVGVLQLNSQHDDLSGALLKFFSDFFNFGQGAHLLNFVEHHVFGVVAELISEGFFDTPACWGLFADACRYAE